MALILLAAFSFTNAFGEDVPLRGRGGKRPGPPPEAYTACEGRCAGDTAGFVGPRGETITGVCEQDGDRLVLRPDRSGPPR